ncbi:conserved hypothetical protein, partial [Ricinus communis]
EAPDAAAAGVGRRAPDQIDAALQLGEHAGGADKQRDETDHQRDHAIAGIARPFQDCTHRLCAIAADQRIELLQDRRLRRVAAKREPGDRDHDQQQWRQRKDRVVRDSRAHARCAVADPRFDRVPEGEAQRLPGEGCGGVGLGVHAG